MENENSEKSRNRCGWVLVLILILLLFLSVIATFIVSPWISFNDKENDGKYSWTGSLFRIKEGLNELEGELYADVEEYVCGSNSEFAFGSKEANSEWCSVFEELKSGSLAYLLFEGICLIWCLLWIVTVSCFVAKVNCLWLGFIFAILSGVFHYLAFFRWSEHLEIEFGDDCQNINEPKLCAEDGVWLAIFIMFIIPLLGIIYCFIACKAMKNFPEEDYILRKIPRNKYKEKPRTKEINTHVNSENI